ncbi:CCR4-Not complex component [Metarhizium robertsii]|uniref:General negative regulator of transcription subunit n=2 Tax=Metarhizium robertsii TaxID=568076 RepID=E9ERB0_METRA|nr:CCR4-NOT transcription complex, subunit 3 [Metarhizium robertsii ARSEF 23]EFZ01923.1 CCR4-NOT transcription complex, subunit 3 [Metarhizium robertsii ARSEF 23]EXV02421.1 CCR4-Not complex component [Metarhizium robertsii]
MAARKLQQEVDKCFKKVAEGVAEFEAIYDKIEQSNNPAQKEKLEDNLKREIKKLQRLRDQIKTWAASNDIKDKAPLLEHRKLIETQMEKFKAVEKAMKTKAYSKEGLSAAAKLDPKEQAKVEAGEFLSNMVDDLEQQIESLEAESESIQATMKKGKGQSAKAERMAEIDRVIERHKWHQGKLELIRRSLENGAVETEQVNEMEENIRYYVSDNMNDDFMEDEGIYDELDLEDEEGTYGMVQENEKSSSQDAQSVQDEIMPEPELSSKPSRKVPKEIEASARKASSQTRSPLPALATLHTPLSSTSTGGVANPSMKPAAAPARPAGEGLKYASAAAAAAASDKGNVGIAPLPPPPGSSMGISPLPPVQPRTSATNSPAIAPAQPATGSESKAPPPPAEPEISIMTRPSKKKGTGKQPAVAQNAEGSTVQTNGATNGIKPIVEEPEESIYHLPSSLQDLVESYETSKKRPLHPSAQSTLRLMAASQAALPDVVDADVPRNYRPDVPMPQTGSGFPREPLPIFDDPRLYGRIDPDTLFYVFYYKQGTAQQYLAAKALKDQSWRFHKQYQTWFQRHEEPKNITEEFEQGTYRFFDYESTWYVSPIPNNIMFVSWSGSTNIASRMNRRKADFKFAYKFLEDEV